MKKRMCVLMTVVLLLVLLTGCGSAQPAQSSAPAEPQEEVKEETSPAEAPKAEPVELHVFAAASLTESLNKIAARYKEEAPEVTLVFNFDSSGKLQTQIENGAEADIFFSAAPKQMNNLQNGGFIDENTRKNLLENQVVLIVPENSADNITGFEQCADKLSDPDLISIGNSDTPVGSYTEEIFTNLNIWETIQPKLSYAGTVKEILSQVAGGSVNCGVLYKTDAVTGTGVKIACVAPDETHSLIIYPVAALKNTKNPEAAQAFLEYLSSSDAVAIFESVGFVLAK